MPFPLQDEVYGLFWYISELKLAWYVFRMYFSVLQVTKSKPQADVREIKNEELSKFELPNKPKNPVQEVESFKKMTLAERRQ